MGQVLYFMWLIYILKLFQLEIETLGFLKVP